VIAGEYLGIWMIQRMGMMITDSISLIHRYGDRRRQGDLQEHTDHGEGRSEGGREHKEQKQEVRITGK
jgi:hypothetical protein